MKQMYFKRYQPAFMDTLPESELALVKVKDIDECRERIKGFIDGATDEEISAKPFGHGWRLFVGDLVVGLAAELDMEDK